VLIKQIRPVKSRHVKNLTFVNNFLLSCMTVRAYRGMCEIIIGEVVGTEQNKCDSCHLDIKYEISAVQYFQLLQRYYIHTHRYIYIAILTGL